MEAQKKPVQAGGMENAWKGWEFIVTEEDMAWLKRCYVGEMHLTDNVDVLREKMLMEGITTINLVPLDGKRVLLKVAEDEDFTQLVKDAEGYFQEWFCRITPWTPEEVARDRRTWVRCQGVPLHVWGDEFFQQLVMTMGSYITVDASTANRHRFDVARVLIRTHSWEAIDRVIHVRVNRLVFAIQLLEEPFVDPLVKVFDSQRSSSKIRQSNESDSESENSVQQSEEYSRGAGTEFEFHNDRECDVEVHAEELRDVRKDVGVTTSQRDSRRQLYDEVGMNEYEGKNGTGQLHDETTWNQTKEQSKVILRPLQSNEGVGFWIRPKWETVEWAKRV